MQQRHQKGFTLVELLVVITIIGTLASIVVVAVNPRGQFLAAKDAGRRQDATQLANALSQYMIDHGQFPGGGAIPEGEANAKSICKQTVSAGDCSTNNGINLAALTADYVDAIPVDGLIPSSAYCTGYMVYQKDGRPQVVAANLGLSSGDTPLGMCGESVGSVTGITVNPTTGLTTTEAGGTATFTVVLDTEPTNTVSITVTSGTPTEALVSNGVTTAASVAFIFTTGNWSTPQTVTIEGQDDAVDDGDVAVSITTELAISTDPAYNGINAADVSATNTDDEATPPGITVNPTTGLITTEVGGTATFTMVLNAVPTDNVSITVTSPDTTEDLVTDGVTTAASVAFIFTTGNWSTPQTVTLVGQNDAAIDGDIAVTITTAAAVSTDGNYSGMNASDVSATNTDNDTGPPSCNGQTATIYVDDTNTIVGGPDNGLSYAGTLNGTAGVDVIVGTNGVDDINASGSNDTICGLDGDDDIDGGSNDNYIDGGAGNNIFTGGSGNDTIVAGDGNNTVNTANGTNSVTLGNGTNNITGGIGVDTITVGNGANTISAGNSNNVISAGGGNNNITTGNNDDTIITGNGSNTIVAAGGADTITTGNGNDVIDAGDGTNGVNAGEGNNSVTGGIGIDTITTGAGDDTIDGGGGNDAITAGDGTNNIMGGAGADTIITGNGADTIWGAAGADIIHAGDGNDTIHGEDNADTICGGGGDDTIFGENGNDLIDGDENGVNGDTIDGGANPDTCVNGEAVSNCTTTTGTVPACD